MRRARNLTSERRVLVDGEQKLHRSYGEGGMATFRLQCNPDVQDKTLYHMTRLCRLLAHMQRNIAYFLVSFIRY